MDEDLRLIRRHRMIKVLREDIKATKKALEFARHMERSDEIGYKDRDAKAINSEFLFLIDRHEQTIREYYKMVENLP